MAEAISSSKIVLKPDIVLNRDDFLPPGLIGVRAKTSDEVGDPDLDAQSSSSIDGDDLVTPELPEQGEDDSDEYFDFNDGLPIPIDMTIISQTVRIKEDRSMSVDVLIETSDFPGIKEFDARVKNDGQLPPGYVYPGKV